MRISFERVAYFVARCAVVLALLVATAFADNRTNFVAIRLKPAKEKGANWLQVDARTPDQIASSELYQKGECFKLTVTALDNKRHRLETLLKSADPIAMSTRTHQQGLSAGVEDVIVAYSDFKSSPARLWNNINIFGPDIATGPGDVLLNLRISNVQLPNDTSRRSYFEQAVSLVESKIQQTQAFSPLINRIVNQVGGLYNTNVTINELPLTKVTKDGYWLIVPMESKDEKSFISSINAGTVFISSEGDVDGIPEKKLPFFLVIKATSMEFEPVIWHSEFGNLVDAR